MGLNHETIRPNDASTPPPVAAIILLTLTKEGLKVLLAPRVKGPVVGKYTFPGGGVEAGEAPDAAAARELREETGLTVAANQLQTLGPNPCLPKIKQVGQLYLFTIGLPACRGNLTQGLDPNLGPWRWLCLAEITRLEETKQLAVPAVSIIAHHLTPPAGFLEECQLISLDLPR